MTNCQVKGVVGPRSNKRLFCGQGNRVKRFFIDKITYALSNVAAIVTVMPAQNVSVLDKGNKSCK